MKNDEFIAELLTAPEGPHCQFKEAKTSFNFTEAVKCCCALSNLNIGRPKPQVRHSNGKIFGSGSLLVMTVFGR